MTPLMFLSIILLGSLVQNCVEFLRLFGFLGRKPRECDYIVAVVFLLSVSGFGYVLKMLIAGVTSDFAWQYFIVGVGTFFYLVLLARGILSYSSLRKKEMVRKAADANPYE